ncbi:MAG TPA: hypothetical protein VMG12_36285 [Polyangiaceae bacterium]|nr:hypothetical protein [Polyangiaceae bacterium]
MRWRPAFAPSAACCAVALLAGGCSESSDVTQLERVAPSSPSAPEAGPPEPEAVPRVPLARLSLQRIDAPALSAAVPGCHLASPIASADGFIAASGDRVRAFSSQGDRLWESVLPAPPGEKAFVVATPLRLGAELFVAYHTLAASAPFDVNQPRTSQRVLALDAASGLPSPQYEPIRLTHTFAGNDARSIPFRADRALARSALVSGTAPDGERLIVSFGNARDIQPWHGFAFELNLELWRSAGAAAALSGSLIVTPEAECGPDGRTGSRDRRCGGGLWAPSGPLSVPNADSFSLVFAPGNGQLDLARGDYANTLLRTGPGLRFEPGCSEACTDFDADAPSVACMESCRDLFIPRDASGDAFPYPESGACDGLSLFECWQALDYVGGSTPVKLSFEGRDVLAYPAKDGAVYLVDYEHLGTLYDRKQLVRVCGTRSDRCRQDWAGMIVTEPALLEEAGRSLLVVPTFMPDATHPAGVFGLALAAHSDGTPRLEIAWQYPPPESPEARLMFREHPTRVALAEIDGTAVAVLVDVHGGGRGRLLALRAADGRLLAEAELDGAGYRFVEPLILGDRLVVPSCERDSGPSHLELFRLSPD